MMLPFCATLTSADGSGCPLLLSVMVPDTSPALVDGCRSSAALVRAPQITSARLKPILRRPVECLASSSVLISLLQILTGIGDSLIIVIVRSARSVGGYAAPESGASSFR